MFKQFIDKVPGADIFMIGSFVTFMAFFVVVSIYLVLCDKERMKEMAEMPLK